MGFDRGQSSWRELPNNGMKNSGLETNGKVIRPNERQIFPVEDRVVDALLNSFSLGCS